MTNNKLVRPCPTCKQAVDIRSNPARPFCSERCRLIDLGAWADENYKIPSLNQDGSLIEPDQNQADED